MKSQRKALLRRGRKNTGLRLLAVKGPVFVWPQQWCLELYILKTPQKLKHRLSHLTLYEFQQNVQSIYTKERFQFF